MKIVFACDTMGAGGAEKVIATLTNEFVDRGNNVSIIMLSVAASAAFYKLNDKIKLFYLKDSIKKDSFINKTKTLRKTIIEIKPDIVISFLSYVCIYTWLALRNTGIPYIVSERNDPNQRSRIKQFFLNRSFNKASGCVLQTHDAMRWYEKINVKNKTIIHNPVQLSFVPNNIVHRKKQVLFVGRLVDQKNIMLLLESFKLFLSSHNDFALKLYGSGPLEPKVKDYISVNNMIDKVMLLNNSSSWHEDEYQSSLFVLPSKYEGMPNALAEALCLGIPSVAMDCPIGGPKELKKFFPNSLLLCQEMSASSFADCMNQALIIHSINPIIPKELSTEYITREWLNFIERCIDK